MTAPAPPASGRWAMLGVILLARLSLGFQFQSVGALALPLSARFDLSPAGLGLLFGLYMLPGIVLAIPIGMLSGRWGDRPLCAVGLLLMVGGGAVLALADDIALATSGRIASGVGGVVLNILMTKMAADWFEGGPVSTALSLVFAMFPTGIGAALASLGWLAASHGLDVALWLPVLLAGFAALVYLALYRDPPGASRHARLAARLDRREVALASLAGCAWLAYNAAFATFLAFVPAFLIGRDAGPAVAGAAAGAALWAGALFQPAGGIISDRAGSSGPAIRLGAAMVAGGLAAAVAGGGSIVATIAGLAIAGIGFGLPPSAIGRLVPIAVAPEKRGRAFGVFFTWSHVGLAATPAIAGALVEATGTADAAMVFAAVLSAAMIAFHRLFRRRAGGRA
ncbi:MAG: nitrate/nitrite transporter [Alphaproteobacteria bacterium]